MAKATFAAGCFWGVEAAFRQVDGVLATRVGYICGDTDNPNYKDVSTERTGHAEAVEVEFDPASATFEDLLTVFWENHDPTQLNRQGPDTGYQYRSAIFYHDDDQRNTAIASKIKLERGDTHKQSVVTEIVPAITFWEAEEYHQQYLEKRGLSTCKLSQSS